MASKKTSTEPKNEASFDDLLAEIMEDPNRILDPALTHDDILEIQKRINPYAHVIPTDNANRRAVAGSFTNLRAEYLQRFTVTSLVGYVFRMLSEWEPSESSRTWTTKAGEKLAKQEAEARKSAAPLTADDLLVRIDALRELATIAKEAETAAEEAEKKALAAEDESADTLDLFKEAEAAQAKACGTLYAAVYELRKSGLDADERIDAVAAVARKYKSVAEIIDQQPIKRAAKGCVTMPAAHAKSLVETFLSAHFEFNPDAHVRSAYDKFVLQKGGAKASDASAASAAAYIDPNDPHRVPLSVLQSSQSPVPPADVAHVEALKASAEVHKVAAAILRSESMSAAMAAALADPAAYRAYLAYIEPDSPARAAVDKIPPQDTFHRFQYYMEANYEKLRAATESIYHNKPDLDWAIIIYDWFKGSESEISAAFEKFRESHQDEVTSDIKCVDVGQWTLLGDFTANRDKISFYNKNTAVLEQILKRHAEDKAFGQDLMRKRVRDTKAANIRKDGPDAAGLAEYTSTQAKNLSAMGAQKVISKEEMMRLNRAKGDKRAAQELEVIDQCRETIDTLTAAAKVRMLNSEEERRLKEAQADIIRAQEMLEVPDDAVQVDVWAHDPNKGEFSKKSFYTQAEGPKLSSDTTVHDLAPFAQAELARQLNAEKESK